MSQGKALHLVRSSEKVSNGNDHYPTPPLATYALIQHRPPPLRIWEPAAGRGWMAWELERNGYQVTASDLFPYENQIVGNISSGKDFLDPNLLDPTSHGIITNPPYGRDMAQKFIEKATIEYPYVAMLCRLTFAESMKRHVMFTETHRPTDVYCFSGRFSCEEKSFLSAPMRGMIAYAWWVWDKRIDPSRLVYDQRPTRMHWINTREVYESWLESMTPTDLEKMKGYIT